MRGRSVLLWSLVIGVVAAMVASAALVVDTLLLRYQRDVSRMVFNDNVELLDRVRRDVGAESDSLARMLLSTPAPDTDQPYVVVSIEDHRLWYRQGDSVLFATDVATGSGRILERSGSDSHWRFETPRGRLSVVSKEVDPVWVPPDWHYVEEAQRRGLGIVRLNRGERVPVGDGSWLQVSGSDIVREHPDGRRVGLPRGEGNRDRGGGEYRRAAVRDEPAQVSRRARYSSIEHRRWLRAARNESSGDRWPIGQSRVRETQKRRHCNAL